jgi:hypothetical protein
MAGLSDLCAQAFLLASARNNIDDYLDSSVGKAVLEVRRPVTRPAGVKTTKKKISARDSDPSSCSAPSVT